MWQWQGLNYRRYVCVELRVVEGWFVESRLYTTCHHHDNWGPYRPYSRRVPLQETLVPVPLTESLFSKVNGIGDWHITLSKGSLSLHSRIISNKNILVWWELLKYTKCFYFVFLFSTCQRGSEPFCSYHLNTIKYNLHKKFAQSKPFAKSQKIVSTYTFWVIHLNTLYVSM